MRCRKSPAPDAEEGLVSMGAVGNVHFVGIGGAGMCGIAELLIRDGLPSPDRTWSDPRPPSG